MRSTFVIAGLLGILASGRGEEAAQNGWTKTVIVPSNVAWTSTGIKVTREQRIRFEASGEIRLSFDGNDVAVAAGARSGRRSANAPIPSALVGALIGRVNSSKPFSIGNTAQALQMPADGRLFLGVNDDLVADNSGNYVVRVWEPAPSASLAAPSARWLLGERARAEMPPPPSASLAPPSARWLLGERARAEKTE